MLRLFVPGAHAAGPHLTIAGAELRHLRTLRLGPGDRLCVFDEQGGEHDVRIERLGPRLAEAIVLASRRPARDSALFKLVTALDQSGQLQAAIDLLEYQVRSNSTLTLDSVRKLADMWRRRAEQLAGDERTWALVAARHFYAVLLDESPPAWWPQIDPTFKDLTHRLQILPGAPQSWFDVYRRYLEQGGWNMPASALYTSVERGGFRLFPGWVEPYGPPMPGAWRRP